MLRAIQKRLLLLHQAEIKQSSGILLVRRCLPLHVSILEQSFWQKMIETATGGRHELSKMAAGKHFLFRD